jgi:hypothetical protein
MAQDVRKGIRAQLSSVGVTAFQEQPGRVNQMISERIWSAISAEHQALIALWADHVYAARGSNRTAEFIWSNIIAMGTGRHQSDCPSWIVDLFLAIRGTTAICEGELIERLEREFSTPESTWDSTWLPQGASNREALKTKLHLVCSYNILCFAWEQLCSSFDDRQLQELYQVALKIANRENIEETQVAYPGVWRFDLLLFVDRFAIGRGFGLPKPQNRP